MLRRGIFSSILTTKWKFLQNPWASKTVKVHASPNISRKSRKPFVESTRCSSTDIPRGKSGRPIFSRGHQSFSTKGWASMRSSVSLQVMSAFSWCCGREAYPVFPRPVEGFRESLERSVCSWAKEEDIPLKPTKQSPYDRQKES